MLKSLYSGVAGLQSHQVAMDVESNNIANVNTVGFKYSRANFSDLLAQTKSIATAPQGDLGGKNPRASRAWIYHRFHDTYLLARLSAKF